MTEIQVSTQAVNPELEPLLEVSPEELSTNFYWSCGKNEIFNLQTTVRGNPTHDEIIEHFESVKSALVMVVKNLEGHARQSGKQTDTLMPAQADAARNEATGKGPVSMPSKTNAQPSANHASTPALNFPADTLELSINAGKTYYKIKGGKFTKFGVTIWPEALEAAGWDTSQLQATEVYNLRGWTAHYVTKDDGKPDKVIRLENN